MRFLPAAWFTPTLPPIALSTCASSVVGTWTRRQAAQVRRGGEAGRVAEHAAAERHDDGRAVGARADSAS